MMKLSIQLPFLAVIGVVLAASVVDALVDCYECNPCRTIDERSYSTCSGETCLTFDSRSKGGHTFRACLQYYREDGCVTKKVKGRMIKKCYCSTELCNYSEDDTIPSPHKHQRSSNAVARSAQPSFISLLVLTVLAVLLQAAARDFIRS